MKTDLVVSDVSYVAKLQVRFQGPYNAGRWNEVLAAAASAGVPANAAVSSHLDWGDHSVVEFTWPVGNPQASAVGA